MTTEATKTEVGSYFISNYPPFSQWRADAIAELREVMTQPPADVPLGLYLHIPFCRKRCKFCYFKVFTDNRASDSEINNSSITCCWPSITQIMSRRYPKRSSWSRSCRSWGGVPFDSCTSAEELRLT